LVRKQRFRNGPESDHGNEDWPVIGAGPQRCGCEIAFRAGALDRVGY